MKINISYGSNKDNPNLYDYQVILSAKLNKTELSNETLEDICDILNNGNNRIKLASSLERSVTLRVLANQLTGFILYRATYGIDEHIWPKIELDIKTVSEQLDQILSPYLE